MESMLRWLIMHAHADFVFRCSSFCRPLHWAVDRAHADLVLTLLADLNASVNLRDHDGSTPLHYAVMLEHLPILRTLLQYHADPTVADESGETPEEGVKGVKGVTKEILELMEKNKEASKGRKEE
jgi:hypothetical protein